MEEYIDMRTRFLFSPFPDYMFRNKKLSWASKCCYCRLIHYTRLGTDGRCYPSQKTLSEDMNLSTRQIYSLIQELVNEGFLRIKKATGRDVYDHKHDEYLFINHPDCKDIFTDQNFSSSRDQNTYPGPDRAMSSSYKEDNKKEDVMNSKEFISDSQKPGNLNVALLKKRTNIDFPSKTFDRNKLNGIAPTKPSVVVKAKPHLKPNGEIKTIHEFWKNLGLHIPGETTDAHNKNIKTLLGLLNGKLFGKPYTKQQICYSMQNFSLAAFNPDYSPVNKNTIKSKNIYGSVQSYNGNGNGNISMFLQFLEKGPELLKRTARVIVPKNPRVSGTLKRWFVENVLGNAPIKFSVQDENSFAIAADKLQGFLLKHRSALRVRDIHELTDKLCDMMENDTHGKIELVTPYWFQSEQTFNISLPKYLYAKGYMEKRRYVSHVDHSQDN